MTRPIRLVLLGKSGVGKTSITVQHVLGQFIRAYDPTIEDCSRFELLVDGETALLEVTDTSGEDEFHCSDMGARWYQDGDVYAIFFSVTDDASFAAVGPYRDNVLAAHNADRIPTILVASKCDCDETRRVPAEAASELAENFFPQLRGSERRVPLVTVSATSRADAERTFSVAVREARRDGAVITGRPARDSVILSARASISVSSQPLNPPVPVPAAGTSKAAPGLVGGGGSVPTPGPILTPRSGWLVKLGGGVFKADQRRWFVLQGPVLKYYKDATTGQAAVGELNLRGARVTVEGTTLRLWGPALNPEKDKKVYTLQAADETDARLWQAALSAANILP